MPDLQSAAKGLLQLDPATFAADFNRRPFLVRHGLTVHALFALPRLARLAADLSRAGASGSVLYFRADHDINQAYPRAGDQSSAGAANRTFVSRNLARPELSPEDVVEQIESCNAWMQIRNIGADPEYAALLESLLAEIRPLAEPLAGGTCDARADVFVSSPGATTPFHLDEEHNVLLQIRGSKRISIADGSNRAVLSEDDLDAFYRGEGELAPWSPRLEAHAVPVDLAPGLGVHIPPCHPHWVQNGESVSISLGVVWHSDVTAARRQLFRVNRWLRSLGLRPAPAGRSPRLDALKVAPLQLKRRALRLLRGPGRTTRSPT